MSCARLEEDRDRTSVSFRADWATTVDSSGGGYASVMRDCTFLASRGNGVEHDACGKMGT